MPTPRKSRPRMGAWIEMLVLALLADVEAGRPRMGAWIEIKSSLLPAG